MHLFAITRLQSANDIMRWAALKIRSTTAPTSHRVSERAQHDWHANQFEHVKLSQSAQNYIFVWWGSIVDLLVCVYISLFADRYKSIIGFRPIDDLPFPLCYGKLTLRVQAPIDEMYVIMNCDKSICSQYELWSMQLAQSKSTNLFK